VGKVPMLKLTRKGILPTNHSELKTSASEVLINERYIRWERIGTSASTQTRNRIEYRTEPLRLFRRERRRRIRQHSIHWEENPTDSILRL